MANDNINDVVYLPSQDDILIDAMNAEQEECEDPYHCADHDHADEGGDFTGASDGDR